MPGWKVHIDPDWLADAYERRGLSIPQIAAEAGLTIGTVHRRLMAHGIPTRARGIRAAIRDPSLRAAAVLTADYLADAHRKGLRPADIARATGFGSDTVARHMGAHGLPVEPSVRPIEVDARRLAALVAEGVRTAEIAAIFGCSITTVQHRITDYGIRAKAPALRRYDMPPERLAEMVADGRTVVEMAAEFGCHHSTVSARIRRLGLR